MRSLCLLFNSRGDVELIMKATGEPGWHFILSGVDKGAETRPNNLTCRFHFAFEVTGEASAGLER
jgi:hypothetical protein